MPKQLNVNLAFTADTSKAKAQLASLQKELSQLTQTVGSKSPLGITQDINNAIDKVQSLQAALTRATTSSGKLDLGQFRQELNKANLDAHKISEALYELGPEGAAAFAKLAQSVTLAEVPIKRINNTLTQFATTLANTARWQISSSVLHGFAGAIRNAYNYAQDLNKSLNSIRVVSGQSSEQMAEFAKHANESAKALSATTTAYTDAALIFFQQGLTGEDVNKRTDAVIKMSNVTGDSVAEVSSYMTAIWNNFDDGSESLEHYADVITALGAATASSSAEISAGLEKFASIAQTVGLSYDYATSALATVVATTRQSEDTVGTAFKTIFARIQGLKLGETLEDGVNLNKYSEALNAVGVQVLDLSGEMRNLDDILDDLAAKWKTLSSAQQTALAQTVAGTRQYNQLVALMSNWDFMEQNLEVAKNAEGALQEQANIYAESWEAAQKRVRAAWQEIYTQLLDDNFFIKLTNGFGKVVESISNVIDTFNGIKGIVPLLSTALLNLFGKQLSDSMSNFVYNLQLSYGGMQKIIEERQKFNNELVSLNWDKIDSNNSSFRLGELYKAQGDAQNLLIEKTIQLEAQNRQLSDLEQEKLKRILDQNNALIEQYEQQSKILEQAKEAKIFAEDNAYYDVNYRVFKQDGKQRFQNSDEFDTYYGVAANNQTIIDQYKQLASSIKQAFSEGLDINDIKSFVEPALAEFEKLNKDAFEGSVTNVQALKKEFQSFLENISPETLDKFISKLKGTANLNLVATIDKLKNKITETDVVSKKALSALNDVTQATTNQNIALINEVKAYNNVNKTIEKVISNINALQGTVANIPDKIVAGTKSISSFAMALNSLSGIIDTWYDSNKSGLDKVIASAISLGMALPMLMSSMKGLYQTLGITDTAFGFLGKAIAAKRAQTVLDIATTKLHRAEQLRDNAALEAQNLIFSQNALFYKKKIQSALMVKAINEDMTAEQVLANLVQKEGITLNDAESASLIKYIEYKMAAQQAVIANTDAIELENAAKEKSNALSLASPTGLVIAGITAVIAIITALIKVREKEIQKQKEQNEAEIERINKLQEEADANKKLADSYINLYNTYKETGDGKDQLVDITDQLVEKYNLEGAALARLTGDYDALTDSIKKARSQELESLISETNRQIYAAERNIFPSIYDNQGAYEKLLSIGDNNRIDLAQGRNRWYQNLIGSGNSLYGSQFSIEEMDQKAYDILNRYSNLNISNGLLQIDTSDPKEALAIYKDLVSAYDDMRKTMTEAERSSSAAFSNIGDFIDANKEAFEQIEQSYDKLYTYQIEQAFISANLSQNTTAQELKEKIEDVTDALGSSIDNIDEYIDKYLSGINEISSAYEKTKLAEKIVDATEYSLDEALDLIKDYNDTQIAFLNLHLNLATLDNDLDTWMGKHSDIITKLGEQGSKFAISSALETLVAGSSLGEETINNLFNDETIASFIGTTQSNFTTMDSAEQIHVLTNAYIENTKAVVENKEEIINSLQEEQKAYTDAADIYNNKLSEIQKNIEEFKENGKEFGYSLQEVEKAFIALNEAGSLEELKKTNVDIYNLIKAYQDYAGLHHNQLLENAKTIAQNKASADAYNELTKIIQQVSNAEYKHAEAVERIKEVEKQHSKILDDIQSNYESLKAAVDNFNKTGSWSIDNLQTLINMDDRYVAALTLENGQITFNTNVIEQMTIAKLEELKASITLEYQEKMLAIAENEEADAALAAGAASIAAGSDFLTMGDQAIQASKGIDLLNETLNKISGENASRRTQQAIEAQQAYAIKLAAIDQSIEDIRNGNLDDVMSKNSKSSGGSGSTDTKKVKEYLKEFDKLYSIKKAIEDLTDAISDLNKEESHLTGRSLAEALEKENELLTQQKDLYLELLNQQSDYRDELAGALEQYGATFDYTTGNLTNYLEITQGALDKYNAAVEAYNSSHDKGAFSVAEQEYEYFKEVLSAYQTILTDMQETQNNLDDNFLKQIENNLKGFEADIKVNLDFEEARRKVNNFFKEIGNNFKKVYKSTQDWVNLFNVAADNVTTYTEASGTIATDLKAIQEVTEYLNNEGYKNPDENSLFVSRDDAINKYKELTEQLMSDAHDLYDLYEDTWNNYLDAIDEVKSQWNDILKGFDRVTNTLKHYEKITNLLYGGDQIEAGRAYLDQIYSATSASSLARQDVLRKEIDALQKEYDQILASGVAETDKDLVELKEAIQDAESSLESEIENYLDVIQNQLTNSIKSIMNTADKLMTNDRGINPVIERWNDSRDAAEGYYDEVERVYELERMESLWEDAISKTSTLKNQQYLTNIMNEQLKNLREKTKLSEYDIGLAEKELQIYQAQMALEDARANKNAMKLVRNEQGNWAYQYVTDEDDIASKEEDLLNSLYEKYEYVKNANIQATEDLLQLYQTAQERLTALLEEYKTADEARRAEITEEYEYLYNYYYGPEGLIIQKATETHAMEDDLNIAGMELLWDLYETDVENYNLMIESEKALIDALRDHDITTFRELIEAVATGDNSLYNQLLDKVTQVTDDSRTEWEELAHEIIANWATNPDSVKNIIADAYNSIMLKVAEYDYAIALSEYKSGVAWSNITDHVLLAQWAVDSVYDSVWNVINQTDGLNDFRNRVNAIGDAWNLVAQNIANATNQMTGFLQLLGVSAQVNIPDYQKILNPIANNKTFTADSDGGAGNSGLTSSAEKTIRRQRPEYYILGPDQSLYNGEHDVTLASGFGSKGAALQYMEEVFGTDRGQMGNYYRNGRMSISSSPATLLTYSPYSGYASYDKFFNGDNHSKYPDSTSLISRLFNGLGQLAISTGVENSLNNSIESSFNNPELIASNPFTTVESALAGSLGGAYIFNVNADFSGLTDATALKDALESLPNLASQYLSTGSGFAGSSY